jgi:hypothetical protein
MERTAQGNSADRDCCLTASKELWTGTGGHGDAANTASDAVSADRIEVAKVPFSETAYLHKQEFQRFFTALSDRPGMRLLISVHLLKKIPCNRINLLSSSTENGSWLKEGSR